MSALGAAYQPLVAEIHLETPAGDDVARSLEVLEELRPVVQPLALTLLLGCWEHDGAVRADLDPDAPAWQLVERGLPERIRIEPPDAPGVRRREVEAIDRDEVARWAAEGLAQPAPGPGLTVDLASLHCFHVRAPVAEGFDGEDGYRLLHPDGVLDLPLERRDGRAWVLAPADGLHLYPPVAWTVKRSADWLRADVSVNWSPWLDLGRPEGAGVRAAAERLRERGWDLAEPAYALELVP
jgi:hypothetical protein